MSRTFCPTCHSIDLPSSVTNRVWRPLRSKQAVKGRQLRYIPIRAVSPTVEQMTSKWLSLDTDAQSIAKVEQLLAADDGAELQSLMSTRLAFGTAGLRAKMGPGFNRMNSITVQQTTQGLCTYLEQECPAVLTAGGIAIGYDGRHNSLHFARVAAAVFISRGVTVHLLRGFVPTPLVPFTVTLKGCAAGIMITASHNPKDYNGYKLYWSNGCQIIPPLDVGIAAAIDAEETLWELPGDLDACPLLQDPTSDVAAAYFSQLACLSFTRDKNPNAAQVVYTPLHGVGAPWLLKAFAAFNLPAPIMVEEQSEADPEFPTVDFPNPEEGQGVWSRAFATAEAAGCSVALANDPDADRLAAAELHDGTWRAFTGNEIALLLADWLWTQTIAKSGRPAKAAMLASTVSSKMLARMAKEEGFHFEETLTGFKWLGNRVRDLETQGYTVLFAFEEAIGFMVGSAVRDKDGISAAAVFAEMTAHLQDRGLSLSQQLEQLKERYGPLEYRASYFVAEQPALCRDVFDRLREGGKYAQSLGGVSVAGVRDLGTGLDTSAAGGKSTLPWTPGDMMITYTLEGGGTLTVRASGTEPKLKYYLEVGGSTGEAAAALADRLEAAIDAELIMSDGVGLRRRSE